jgi:hypothetical protein
MDNFSHIITAGVGPIIVISACGLLCLALYNRLAAVVTRLRAFHRERLHEQEALNRARKQVPADETATVMHHEVLGMLETQTRHVTRRAKLIRNALACLLAAVACLAICSLALGMSAFLPHLIYVAAVLFVLGLLLLIAGIGFALVEIRHALDPIELESRFVREMVDQFEHL